MKLVETVSIEIYNKYNKMVEGFMRSIDDDRMKHDESYGLEVIETLKFIAKFEEHWHSHFQELYKNKLRRMAEGDPD